MTVGSANDHQKQNILLHSGSLFDPSIDRLFRKFRATQDGGLPAFALADSLNLS
jgi:hypothetical protein